MEISADLVRRLVDDQFPEWSGMRVRPVEVQGNDNRSFRLGDDLVVRLPSAEGYVAGVAKEDAVLPHLAQHVTVALPVPVATGVPACGYPWAWSVRRWLPGATLDVAPALDRLALARDLGAFLLELRRAPTLPGFEAGAHSFHRGAHPSAYAEDVEWALDVLGDRVDRARCRAVWAASLGSRWAGPAVWFHGDVAVGNLLAREGRLVAAIDLGTCGTGDPACDLVVAWTLFRGAEREVLAEAVDADDDTWSRARGWALWKALVSLAVGRPGPHLEVQAAALAEVLRER